ncbi:hypothetical protein [Rhodococcus koreensis]
MRERERLRAAEDRLDKANKDLHKHEEEHGGESGDRERRSGTPPRLDQVRMTSPAKRIHIPPAPRRPAAFDGGGSNQRRAQQFLGSAAPDCGR